MIKIAVCDDEPRELEAIGSILTDYLQSHPDEELKFTLFSSPAQLIEHIPNEFFHIYLLDILMEGTNGIELGDLIHQRYKQALLIYLTVSPDYAIASYSVNAYFYLLKPLEKEKLLPVLERAIDDCRDGDDFQIIRTKAGTIGIMKKQIMYVEYANHALTYHLLNGSCLDSRSFRYSFDEAVGSLLANPRFVKISSSFLVNLSCVQGITAKGFLMPDGAELSITRRYAEARHRYLEHMLQRARRDL